MCSKFGKTAFSAASRYFRDAHKSIHVYAHENDATTLRPSRPAAESATMTRRQYALPAAPGQRLPSWGSSAPASFECIKISKRISPGRSYAANA